MVPWLRIHLCNAGTSGSIPGWGTKIPHAAEQLSLCATTTVCISKWKATKTRCSQINTKKKNHPPMPFRLPQLLLPKSPSKVMAKGWYSPHQDLQVFAWKASFSDSYTKFQVRWCHLDNSMINYGCFPNLASWNPGNLIRHARKRGALWSNMFV